MNRLQYRLARAVVSELLREAVCRVEEQEADEGEADA